MTYSDISGAPGSTVTQILQPPITWVAPSTLTFPAQQIGTSSLQQTVTVFAGSQVTLTGISFVDNTPGASADFASVPGPGGGNLNLQNGQLVITVWFRPTAGGTRNAQLLIAHNSAGSPLIVELSGVGNAAPLPLLKFSPASLLFTTTKITSHTVTLTNTGTAPLTINSIAIDRPSSFTFGTTCSGGILNPGQTCTITVSYHGVVSSNANLVITHNAVGSPAMIGIEADLPCSQTARPYISGKFEPEPCFGRGHPAPTITGNRYRLNQRLSLELALFPCFRSSSDRRSSSNAPKRTHWREVAGASIGMSAFREVARLPLRSGEVNSSACQPISCSVGTICKIRFISDTNQMASIDPSPTRGES